MIRSRLQEALLNALATLLTPIVKLLLQAGVGYSEFAAIAKSIFVTVAIEEYGVRGRPTNTSRVAAMTGISRKEVSKIRKTDLSSRWSPSMEANPANLVIHYWHHDPDYSLSPGQPKALPFSGNNSFVSLVARYAGDIPAGAMRAALTQAGTLREEGGLLLPTHRHFYSTEFDQDFVRNIAFSMSNLAGTIFHNAQLRRQPGFSKEVNLRLGRFERSAWTEHIDQKAAELFRRWVYSEGAHFIEKADDWLGNHELGQRKWQRNKARTVGVGLYYFEE